MRSDATLRSSARLAPLALFGVLTACHPAAPVKRADLAPLPAPEAALAELRAAGAKRQNLRALGRLTYFGEKGRVRLKAVLVADRPNRVRFETVSPLEQPLDVMTVDGSRLYLLSKEKLAIGPATPENVARLLPFPMHPEELSIGPAACTKCGMALEPAVSGAYPASAQWTCPMHPEVRQTGPGRCPKCGMHLVPEAEASGAAAGPACHGHEHHGGDFQRLQPARMQVVPGVIERQPRQARPKRDGAQRQERGRDSPPGL